MSSLKPDAPERCQPSSGTYVRKRRSTPGHRGRWAPAIIRKLLFTADGRELVSVSDDKTIRVWSVAPDGRQAALARTIRGQMDDGRGGMLAAAALSPAEATGQQRWLAVGGFLAGSQAERDAVRRHDYASGAIQALLQDHTDAVLALAFSPSGRWLASAGKDMTVRLWDLTALQGSQMTRQPVVLTGHTTRYTSDNDRGPLEQQLQLIRLVRLRGACLPALRCGPARKWARWNSRPNRADPIMKPTASTCAGTASS